jgi:hypothetical protein
MKTILTWLLVGVTALVPVDFAAAQRKGVGPWQPVRDEIKFFSPAAKEQADRKIAEIKEKYNKDFFVEATKAPPRPKDLDPKDIPARDRFFTQFAEKRFADMRENGVYVLIVDNPKILRVVVGNNTLASGYFTKANQKALNDLLIEKLKRDDHDGALLSGVNYVYDTMAAHHTTKSPRKSEVVPVGHVDEGGGNRMNWSPIITVVLVVLGVWILFAVVRALFRTAAGGGGYGAPGMGYGGPGYGGGGGFFSNFLGGMFGAAAGMWMYNNFFGHGGSSAWGAGSPGPDKIDGGQAYPDSGPADTSGSSIGGDYGNDAGGGDWGGGADAGGGDWGAGDAGGGDWGGGGGDWGGGGGDWGGGGGGGDW